MKKLLFFLTLVVAFVNANGQEKVNFKLTSSGIFVGEDGKDYAIIPFENKSAHDIYVEILKNIHEIYNDPKEVLSTVEDESISICAQSDKLAYDKFIGIVRSGYGYYKIKISISSFASS